LAIDDWARALDRGHETDIAIFDFSKAFDSVPHRRLITKLDYYGIREVIPSSGSPHFSQTEVSVS